MNFDLGSGQRLTVLKTERRFNQQVIVGVGKLLGAAYLKGEPIRSIKIIQNVGLLEENRTTALMPSHYINNVAEQQKLKLYFKNKKTGQM